MDRSGKDSAGEGDVDRWAADDDLDVRVEWAGGENLSQLGDRVLRSVHLPVSSDTEFARHLGEVVI